MLKHTAQNLEIQVNNQIVNKKKSPSPWKHYMHSEPLPYPVRLPFTTFNN
jgi:hypothetical protein